MFSGIRKAYTNNGYQPGARWSVEPSQDGTRRHVAHGVAILPREVSFVFPSPLRTTKMAFRPLWHAIEAHHAPSAVTQSRRRPSARASPRCLRGVGWLPPRQDGAMPPMPTRRAPSVLGVCGWFSAPRTAHPRVSNALGLFTWGLGFAVSGRAAHYHTLEQPQSLNTRPTCKPRGRGPITLRSHGPYPPPTDPRGVHLERLRSHASSPCIPARPSRWDVPPRSTPPNPLGATTRARCTPGGVGVAAPRSVWRLPTHGPGDTT